MLKRIYENIKLFVFPAAIMYRCLSVLKTALALMHCAAYYLVNPFIRNNLSFIVSLHLSPSEMMNFILTIIIQRHAFNIHFKHKYILIFLGSDVPCFGNDEVRS